MAFLLGALGVVASVVLLCVALFDSDQQILPGITAAIALGFQSVMLIVFGSMMRGLSEVLLAVFEMSVAQTRDKIASDDADQPAT